MKRKLYIKIISGKKNANWEYKPDPILEIELTWLKLIVIKMLSILMRMAIRSVDLGARGNPPRLGPVWMSMRYLFIFKPHLGSGISYLHPVPNIFLIF